MKNMLIVHLTVNDSSFQLDALGTIMSMVLFTYPFLFISNARDFYHQRRRDSTSSFSVGLPVANAPDVLQPCGLLYYP